MEQKNENQIFMVEFNMDNVENLIVNYPVRDGNWCGSGCLGFICLS